MSLADRAVVVGALGTAQLGRSCKEVLGAQHIPRHTLGIAIQLTEIIVRGGVIEFCGATISIDGLRQLVGALKRASVLKPEPSVLAGGAHRFLAGGYRTRRIESIPGDA